MHFLSSPAGRSGVQCTRWPKAHTKQNMGVSSKEQAEGADNLAFLSYVSVGCKKLTQISAYEQVKLHGMS